MGLSNDSTDPTDSPTRPPSRDRGKQDALITPGATDTSRDSCRGLDTGQPDANNVRPASATSALSPESLSPTETLRRVQVAETRFRRLVDANLIGIILADQERITEANDAFLDIVGCTREDLETGSIRWREMTPPEYAPRDDFGIAELLARGECTPFEKEYVRKDGSRVPILIGAAFLEREPLQWVSFVVDLTERKRLERTLAEQAAQLEATFDALGDALFHYDTAGQLVRMNKAGRALLGLDRLPEFATRHNAQELGQQLNLREESGEPLLKERWPLFRALRGEALTGPNVAHVVFRTPDGDEKHTSTSAAPVRDAEGTIIGAVLAIRDVTVAWRLEQEVAKHATEIEAANSRLDELLHIVAHEVRTPLTSLSGNLQLAERRLRRGAAIASDTTSDATSDTTVVAAQDALQRAQQQVGRLTRLLDDLTDTSRARMGKLEVRLMPCDLAALVRTCVAEQKRITKRSIHLKEPVSSVPVVADAARIEQVLINYLTNATKYSPRESPISVTLSVEDGLARVSVRDQGPGLTPEAQQRVWERFQQADNIPTEGTASMSAGLGLGLYISRHLIEGNGGATGVESVVGGGATFWFTLPVTASLTAAPRR